MKTRHDGWMRSVSLASLAAVGLWLAAQGTLAALVTVSGTETWDGTANPHAADGVTLVTNAGPVYVYTIPDGMTITGSGKLSFASNPSRNITLVFVNEGLQIDAGGQIDSDCGTRSDIRSTRFELGANSVTGAGSITGTFAWSNGKRSLVFISDGDLSMNSVTIRNYDSAAGTFSVLAGGSVVIGDIDVSSGDRNSGSVLVRGRDVTVGAIDAWSPAHTSGQVVLNALAYPYFGYRAWQTNSLANSLTLNGTIRTKGTTSTGGSVVAAGVNLTLGASFGTNLNSDTSFVLRRGAGGRSPTIRGKVLVRKPRYITSIIRRPTPSHRSSYTPARSGTARTTRARQTV